MWVGFGGEEALSDANAMHRQAVEAEYAANKALGERLGCWKGGVLVEDDAGSVRAALQQLSG